MALKIGDIVHGVGSDNDMIVKLLRRTECAASFFSKVKFTA